MSIDKALNIFYKSKYAKGKRIKSYVKTDDGYILFPQDGVVRIIGTLYYLVKNNGVVQPVHPMLCDFDEDSIMDVE